MTTTTTTAAASSAVAEVVAVVVDFALPDYDNFNSVTDALAIVNTAKHAILILNTPDTFTGPNISLQGSGRRYFPRFLAAFEAMLSCASMKPSHRKLESCSVRYLSSAKRLALKAVLHDEVKALVEAARTQAVVTPKQFGAEHPLPVIPTECERGVDALMLETHAQIQALSMRMRMLEKAHVTLKRMRGNVEAADALAQADDVAASFAASPAPSSDASAEAGNNGSNNNNKRAKK